MRLLPLMVSHLVQENNTTWRILLERKDIVELLASSVFTTESLCYLEYKISVHRQFLQDDFPDFKLRPKHNFMEHYPFLICCFGPLLDCWTIHFEAKNSFVLFFKVACDVNSFKNILLTLATRHQLMLAYFPGHAQPFQAPSRSWECVSSFSRHLGLFSQTGYQV